MRIKNKSMGSPTATIAEKLIMHTFEKFDIDHKYKGKLFKNIFEKLQC